MRFSFVLKDVQEVSSSTYRAFISTFHYQSTESDSDFESESSDSDLSDFDSDVFGCGEITPEVESMVENTWEMCSPLEEIYGTTTSDIIKETITTATEETQCAGLNLFKYIAPGEDRSLIGHCVGVCFWCCCEGVKKVSPIIAEATINLI